MRPVQYFSDEYLERCRGFTPEQVLTFLEEFRRLQCAVLPPEARRDRAGAAETGAPDGAGRHLRDG